MGVIFVEIQFADICAKKVVSAAFLHNCKECGFFFNDSKTK